MLIDFRELFPRYNIKPKGVLHVGANVGEEAPIYDELGIKEVHWIEANPEIIPKLKSNVSPYGHKVYNFAVGNENKSALLHLSNNGSQSSSILPLGTHMIAHPEVHYIGDVTVEMCRIEDFFRRDGDVIDSAHNLTKEGYYKLGEVDFLNADLQGFELEALRGMGDLLRHFKWAYLEVNKEELYKGCALVGEIDEYLSGFGFKRVETKWCGNTGWGDCLMIKNYDGPTNNPL